MAAAVPVIINVAVSLAINYLLAPDGQDIEGPRLSDRGVQNNSFGAELSIVYGSMLVTGALIWLENNELKETKHKEDQGKGGPSGSVTTYTYSATFAMAMAEGQINGLGKIWADNVLIWTSGADDGSLPLTDQNIFNSKLGAAILGASGELVA